MPLLTAIIGFSASAPLFRDHATDWTIGYSETHRSEIAPISQIASDLRKHDARRWPAPDYSSALGNTETSVPDRKGMPVELSRTLGLKTKSSILT